MTKVRVRRRPAGKDSYEKAKAAAWKALKEATVPAQKAYWEARVAAEKAYDEAVAPAEKAYWEAMAAAMVAAQKPA